MAVFSREIYRSSYQSITKSKIMTTLIDEVTQLNQYYEANKETIQKERQTELEEKRKAARTEALNKITENCVQTIKETASGPGRKEGTPRKEAKLYEWKYSDDVKFNGCYLRDLLNKGNLLEELQAWFDKTHAGKDGSRVFKVYYTMMGGPNIMRRPQDRRYAIFVSWDQQDWDRIDELIQRTKQRFEMESNEDDDQPEQVHQTRLPFRGRPPRVFDGSMGPNAGRPPRVFDGGMGPNAGPDSNVAGGPENVLRRGGRMRGGGGGGFRSQHMQQANDGQSSGPNRGAFRGRGGFRPNMRLNAPQGYQPAPDQ